jgi:ubiquinone/menaquinone biosynthesis C-methylase UbiE
MMRVARPEDSSLAEVSRIQAAYAERARTHKSVDDNPGRLRMIEERTERMASMLDKWLDRPLPDARILDVGCGTGDVLGWFYKRGASPKNLFGIDLVPERIEAARNRYPDFTLLEGSAEQLPFPDQCFDVVLAFTLFSSILDQVMARRIARNIRRVLSGRGIVLWHDLRYPNPWNRNIRGMTRRKIQELFTSFALELSPIYVLPPLARHLGRLTDQLYPLLGSIRLLRSHYCGVLRPLDNYGQGVDIGIEKASKQEAAM